MGLHERNRDHWAVRPVQQTMDNGAEPHALVATTPTAAHDNGQGVLCRPGKLFHRMSGRYLVGHMHPRVPR